MAAEHGIDVATVVGTGEGGRVTKKDVLAFIETRGVAPAPVELAAWEQPGTGELFRPSEEQPGTPVTAAPDVSQTAGETIPLSAMRRAIAEHILRSVSTSPHVTTVFDVDLSRVAAHRQANKAVFERDGANLTYTPYFVAAIVAGLKKHPSVNASWADNAVRLHKAVNVGIFLLRQFFKTVPDDLIDAARIDGLSEVAIVWRVMLPTALPAVTAFGIFSVVAHWNDYFWPLIVINSPELLTPPLGVAQFRNQEAGTNYGVLMAAALVVITPLVIAFLLAQRRFIEGITFTGMK